MWPNPQFPADLVTFTEEIFNGKLHFLYSGWFNNHMTPTYSWCVMVSNSNFATLSLSLGHNLEHFALKSLRKMVDGF